LEKIREYREGKPHDLFSNPVEDYEKLLHEHPKNSIHGLILYLAWDRLCIYMSQIFDYQSTDSVFQENLKVLKECLVESYMHITEQGRTRPSLFRLAEALYYYEMREEYLQTHSEGDWGVLSKSVTVLSSKERIVDVLYVDAISDAVIYTLDSSELVKSRIELAELMRKKLNIIRSENKVVNLRESPQDAKILIPSS